MVNPNDGALFAAASNRTNGGNGSTGLYKSTDCGAHWKLWSTGTNHEKLATGQLWAGLIDPKATDTMYIANGYGDGPTLYKSTNGGVDWLPLIPDSANVLGFHSNFVQAIAIDSDNSQHIAVSFHDDCKAPFLTNCFSTSPNAGQTWTVFSGPPEMDGWQEAASLTILGANRYLYTCGDGAFLTENQGQSWKKVLPQSVFGRYGGSTYLSADRVLYLGTSNEGVFASREDLLAQPPVSLGSSGSWQLIAGSPHNITNLVADEGTLIGATRDGPPFYRANVSALTSWSLMDSPGVIDGSNMFAQDKAQHLIYSANFENGLVRLKVK